jgi:hypothetical protein
MEAAAKPRTLFQVPIERMAHACYCSPQFWRSGTPPASGPFKAREQRGRTKIEKTRPRNLNRLTVNQHVFPSKSIERFTGKGKRVAVYDLHRNEVVRARPGNPVFLAFRAWDQRAESGYMKRIEDEFQNIRCPDR